MTQALTDIGIEAASTATILAEELQGILTQVEVELYRTELYGRIVASLLSLPTDVSCQVHKMVRAIAREAIRATARNLTDQEVVAVPVKPTAKTLPPPAPPPSVAAVSAIADVTPIQAANTVATPAKTQNQPPQKRLSKKEKAAVLARQTWEAELQNIGQHLRQSRLAKSLSLSHIHLRTQIPIHQLEALETGHIQRLPEDVYIRGFIRQIGNVLGLDGVSLAKSLPAIDPIQAVLPTWQQPQANISGFHLRPLHLYAGYAALMAGGLSWVSYQTTQTPLPPLESSPSSPQSAAINAPTASVSAIQEVAPPQNIQTHELAKSKPVATKVNENRPMPLPANIAPPEVQRR